MDIEGFECQAVEGGQLLFSKYRPKFMQFELLDRRVNNCLPKMLHSAGYVKGKHVGHDHNTVFAPSEMLVSDTAPPPVAASEVPDTV